MEVTGWQAGNGKWEMGKARARRSRQYPWVPWLLGL